MSQIRATIWFLLSSFCSISANAGVISLTADAGISHPPTGLSLDSCFGNNGSCAAISDFELLDQKSEWRAYSAFDVKKGTLKAKVEIAGNDSQRIDFHGSQAIANVRITETLKVISAGNFTFNMAFDGFWDLSLEHEGSVEGSQSATWAAVVGISLHDKNDVGGPPYGANSWQFQSHGGHHAALGLSNNIDSIISFTQFLEAGEYDFFSYTSTSMGNGVSGVIDFSNTAKIYVETFDGAFEYETANFLVEPAYLGSSAVPVPGSLALLTLGLAGLSLSRKRFNRST